MKNLMLLGMLGVGLMVAPSAHAQPVSFGFSVGVGPVYAGAPPVCQYGYYGYYPYACAPYGYYGPGWFSGGVFIGAGPWFHGFSGRPGFYGRPGIYGHPGFYGRSGYRSGAIAHGYARGGTAWRGSHGIVRR
jgi:hypothetical protein